MRRSARTCAMRVQAAEGMLPTEGPSAVVKAADDKRSREVSRMMRFRTPVGWAIPLPLLPVRGSGLRLGRFAISGPCVKLAFSRRLRVQTLAESTSAGGKEDSVLRSA